MCALLAAAFSGVSAAASGPAERAPRHPDNGLPSIRVSTDLVLVPVTVTDSKGRLIGGLGRESFRVFDDKTEFEISHFSEEDVPVSVGIVFDTSASMKTKLGEARNALAALGGLADVQDEFFVVRFSSRPELIAPFGRGFEGARDALFFTAAEGSTALLDAVDMALRYMKNARNPRRALVVVSDGGDNHSRNTRRDLRRLVQETDVPICSVGIYTYGTWDVSKEENDGPDLLAELSFESGGRHLEVPRTSQLADAIARLGRELHNQYVLGFCPKGDADGKYHRLRVQVTDRRRLQVLARPGYYATGNQK